MPLCYPQATLILFVDGTDATNVTFVMVLAFLVGRAKPIWRYFRGSQNWVLSGQNHTLQTIESTFLGVARNLRRRFSCRHEHPLDAHRCLANTASTFIVFIHASLAFPNGKSGQEGGRERQKGDITETIRWIGRRQATCRLPTHRIVSVMSLWLQYICCVGASKPL